jgi:glutamate decarboxylase
MITEVKQLDNNPRLNTSSYVNVVSEPEEREVAVLAMQVNMADQTVYPASFKMHNFKLNMVANLWDCPQGNDFDEMGVFPGAGTNGSTEACLLAGLALKMRWRS